MTIYYLILLLPLVCTGFRHDGITIKIKLAPTKADVTIEQYGKDIEVATDSELAAFNLTKDQLDDAVETFSGERATDIFTRSPTPWDLYKRHNWPEVRREFIIKNITVLNVTIVKEKKGVRNYINNDTILEIRQWFHTVHHDFLSEHHWGGNDKISASVKYLMRRPHFPYSLGYGSLSKVGQTRFETGLNVAAIADGVQATFKLQPRQRAETYLEATSVFTRVSVQYETVLSGYVAVNYEEKRQGHHFWAYEVNEVLAASKLPTRVVSNEFVQIQYIKDFKPKVVDVSTGVDIPFTLV